MSADNDVPVTIPTVIVPPPIQPATPTLAYQPAVLPPHPTDWTNVRFYAMTPDAMSTHVWRGTIRRSVMICIGVGIGVFGFYFVSAGVTWDLTSLAIRGVVLAILLALTMWRTWARLHREAATYRLIVSDQGLQRNVAGYANLTILNHQITKILQSSYGILVRTARRQHFIAIPAQTENYDEICAHVAALHEITPVRRPLLRVIGVYLIAILLVIPGLGSLALGLTSRQLSIELLCLATSCVIWGWTSWSNIRNPNLPTMQKFTGLVVLLFPLVLGLKILILHLITK